MEAPDQWSPRRARGRRSGLTIHVLEAGRYRESPVSLVFPDWRARAIPEALNEPEPTGWTHARLERMGRVLGEREGTGPDDHPLMRSLRDQSRAEGERRGRVEGERNAQARMVRQILRSPGLEVSEEFPAGAAAFAASSDEAIAAAALACSSERDFLTRLDRAPGG